MMGPGVARCGWLLLALTSAACTSQVIDANTPTKAPRCEGTTRAARLRARQRPTAVDGFDQRACTGPSMDP